MVQILSFLLKIITYSHLHKLKNVVTEPNKFFEFGIK